MWVWRELVGVDGVVLYVRHLQFLFSLLVSAAVLVGLRSVLRSTSAALLAAVREFADGAPQEDDITVVLLRREAAS